MRRLTRIAAFALTALALGAFAGGVWLSRADDRARAEADVRAAQLFALRTVEVEALRLRAALGEVAETPMGSLSRLRLLVSRAIGAAAASGALAPLEIETLSRLASDLGIGETAPEPAVLAEALDRDLVDLSTITAAHPVVEADTMTAPLLLGGGGALALLAIALGIAAMRSGGGGGRGMDPLDEAALLAEARVRFETLIGHEMRTPLRGVVDAVGRARADAAAAPEALEMAQRSAAAMLEMLEDAMREHIGPASPETFTLDSLEQSVNAVFAPAAAREGFDLAVAVAGATGQPVTGDSARFRRAVAHLCGFVVDRAGADDLHVVLAHSGTQCRATISFDSAPAHAAPQPQPQAPLRTTMPPIAIHSAYADDPAPEPAPQSAATPEPAPAPEAEPAPFTPSFAEAPIGEPAPADEPGGFTANPIRFDPVAAEPLAEPLAEPQSESASEPRPSPVAAATAPAEPEAEGDDPGLGAVLCEELLDLLGGRLDLSTVDSGRVMSLSAAAPSPAAPKVRVIAQTRSLGALGAAAAIAASVDVVASDEADDPHVVLIEAGGGEEASAVAEVTRFWPSVPVIALGAPANPDAFARVVPTPLTPSAVAQAVAQACGGGATDAASAGA